MKRGVVVAWLAVFVGLATEPALAHEGPPFPLIVDSHVGPYLVSVWTDPDIGTGTFYVVLEPEEGETLPESSDIQVAVRPVSGRLEEVIYDARPQRVRHGQRYMARVQFDRGEMWDVRVDLAGPEGGGELRSQVEATPSGSIGPIGLLLYPLPFLAVGILWFRAAVVKRRQAAA